VLRPQMVTAGLTERNPGPKKKGRKSVTRAGVNSAGHGTTNPLNPKVRESFWKPWTITSNCGSLPRAAFKRKKPRVGKEEEEPQFPGWPTWEKSGKLEEEKNPGKTGEVPN